MSQPGQSGSLSSSSESEEQEIRRIKSELQKRGFKEDSTDLELLKGLLKAVVISAESAGNSMKQTVPQDESPEPLSLKGPTSYADRLKSENDRKSKSPELPFKHTNKNLSQEKKTDSTDDFILVARNTNTLHKNSKENRNSNDNRNRRSGGSDKSFEPKNENKRGQHKTHYRTRYEEKPPELKLTSLDFDNNEGDTCLIPRYRLSKEKSPQDGSSIKVPDNDRILFDRLQKHLLQTAELCHVQRTSSVALNFQWGTAIKVGEPNGSVEREIDADEEVPEFNDNTDQPETSTRYGFTEETTRRRKRNTNMVAIYEYGDAGDSDKEEKDDSDEDFQLDVKRQRTERTSHQKKATSTKTGSRKKVESTATKQSVESSSSSKKPENRAVCVDVSDECAITDDEATDQPPKKVQRCKSEESEPLYPRRVVPPRPGPKWAGIRARKPLNNSSSQLRVHKPAETNRKEETLTTQRSKSNLFLQDDEIAKVLEENDGTDETEGVTPLRSDSDDFKPLRTSTRMKMQTQRLVQMNEKEKEKEAIRLEHEKMKDEMIHREKMRRVQQRIREGSEKQKLEEAEARRKAQREENWRNLIAQGSKQRVVERTELHPDGRPQNEETLNYMQGNHSTMNESDDETQTDTCNARDNNSKRVPCPICNRKFEVDEIEAHAAACEEFDSCPPGFSRSSSPSLTPPRIPRTSRPSIRTTYECEVCQNFSTENGKDYESHSYECVKRQKYGQGFTPDSVIEVPTSPIRTVRTISELTDSEINYKSQFEPKTKSKKTVTKKKRWL